jgi:hypothetical protein
MDRRLSKDSPISRTVAFLARTVAFLALLAASARAYGQTEADKKQAQTLQVTGVRLMDRGDNRAALDKFEAAFRLFPSPKILFNMGKAHHALGQEVEAVGDLERFLDEAPYAPKESRDEAERLVAALHPKLSYLDLVTDDVGSLISVDGHQIGAAPLPRPLVVPPGAHEVRFDKPGMTAETRTVSPVAGQKLRVYVKLAPVANAPAPAPPTPVPATAPAGPTSPPAAVSPAVAKAVAAPQPPGAPAGAAGYPWQLKAAWISGGAGVLLLAGGITAQVLSASKNADFNNVTTASPNGQCNKNLPNDGGGPCQGLLSSANARFTLAVVGYVASGLALAGSLVFYLTAPARTAGNAAAVACLPSGESSGLSCALTMRF